MTVAAKAVVAPSVLSGGWTGVMATRTADSTHRLTEGFIDSEADLAAGIAALSRRCADMRRARKVGGMPQLRRYPPGIEGLARIVVGQQVSIASAEAIWGRTRAAIQPFDATTILELDDEGLRSAGLSRPKVRTLRAVAKAVAQREVDLESLAAQPEAAARQALVAITGIGPWTADIYLMFCAGRADAFAPGDLALQIATASLLHRPKRCSPDELTRLAERWRPLRGVAARLLWAYYTAAREGGMDMPA